MLPGAYITVDILQNLCTGYEYDFPFLDVSCAVKVVDGKLVSSLYKHCISTKHPTLCIIGVPMFALPFSLSDIQV